MQDTRYLRFQEEYSRKRLKVANHYPTGSNKIEGTHFDVDKLEKSAAIKRKDHAYERTKCKRLLAEYAKPICLKNVKTYLVPASCFPRYEYALENIEDIFLRYKKIFRKHLNGCIQREKISIHICNGEDETWIAIDDILLQVGNNSKDDLEMTCERKGTIERLMQINLKEKATSIIITVKGQKNLIKWGAKNALGVVVVAANKREKRAVSRRYKFRFKRNLVVTTLTTAAEDLCNFLERLAFSTVKRACEDLYNHLQYHSETDTAINSDGEAKTKLFGKIETDPKDNRKRIGTGDKRERTVALETSLQGTNKPSQTAFLNKRNSHRITARHLVSKPAKEHTSNNVKGVSKTLFTPYMISKRYLQKTDFSIKESLLEEMLALYKISNVLRKEWPDIPRQTDRKVSKEISERIFRACPIAKGVGYRFNTLQVMVEEKTSKESVCSIEKLLRQMKIEKYSIEFLSMKEFSRVGSEVYVDNPVASGSLGGFVTMKRGSETSPCVLLSKHVAAAGKGEEGRNGRVVAVEEEGHRLLGYVLQDTVPDTGYDIAAARLDVDVTTCDTAFKNSKGKAMKASAKSKSTLRGSLRGRKVHLWGAKSKPGKGVVTVPYYKMDGMDEHFVQVEDLYGEPKRFAEPGDSGAIACADDHCQASVHPVSMTIGILNHEEIEEDNKRDIKTKRGKYLTVPLSAGLEQLGTRTGSTFDLITE